MLDTLIYHVKKELRINRTFKVQSLEWYVKKTKPSKPEK